MQDQFDTLIDFTGPAATLEHVKLWAEAGKTLVIDTTGCSDADKQKIAEGGKRTRIVFAPNMSISVNLCFKLLEMAASIIGEESDIEIIEAHHRHKKGATSGTALRKGEVIAKQLGRELKDVAGYGREGVTGERVEITRKSGSRLSCPMLPVLCGQHCGCRASKTACIR